MYTQEEHKEFLDNIRNGGVATGVRLIIGKDSCPVCQHHEGGYKFDDESNREIPILPFEGCSCVPHCHAFYSPILDRRGP